METPAGKSQNEVLFQYSWAIVREIDRINRSSQKTVSLDQRIHKLRGMAEPFLRNKDTGEVREEYEGWIEEWDHAGEEAQVPKEVRWEQFALLIRLFHREGIFEEESIHWGDITYWEYDQP